MICAIRAYHKNCLLIVNRCYTFGYSNRPYNNGISHPSRARIKTTLKPDVYLKEHKYGIRTTQTLHVPPFIAFIIRPVLRISSLLIGRKIRKWWQSKTEEEKQEYRKSLEENRNVFIGSVGLFGFMLLVYYLCHIERDPLTHRARFIAFNERQKREIEEVMFAMHLEANKSHLLKAHHPLYQRLSRVTTRLLEANKDLTSEKQWTLTVINSPLKNAYVLPGGNIFVFMGVLEIVENEDQLSIILAHEMAHALLQHSMEQFSNQILMEIVMVIPIIVLWAIFPDFIALLIQMVGQTIIGIILNLPYSRALETEADEVGLKLAAKACVDVREAVAFWGIMRTLAELNTEETELPTWLSTHPNHGDREKTLNQKIPEVIELRKKHGCPDLNPVDPRQKFYGHSKQRLKNMKLIQI